MSRARTILSRASALVLTVALFTGVCEAQEGGALPFGEQELTEALSARAPHIDSSNVSVQAAGDLFLVTLGAKSRVLDLAGANGLDAARVVALVAADLALAEEPSVVVAEPAPTQQAEDPRVAVPPPERVALPDSFRLGAQGSVLHGLQRNDTWGFMLGLTGDFVARRVLTTLTASYWTMPTAVSRWTLSEIQFDALSLRAGVGVQFSQASLALGPAYARYWVRGGSGHTGNLFGLSLQGSMWLPAARHIRVGIRGYIDGYMRRALFYAGGSDVVLATPGIALGIALAVAWGAS